VAWRFLQKLIYNSQTDRMQNDYKYSMKGWSQVITGVKFNYTAVTQGALNSVHLISPPSERKTKPYTGIQKVNSDHMHQCVTNSTAPRLLWITLPYVEMLIEVVFFLKFRLWPVLLKQLLPLATLRMQLQKLFVSRLHHLQQICTVVQFKIVGNGSARADLQQCQKSLCFLFVI